MAKRRKRRAAPPPERRLIAERWRAFRDSTGSTQDEWAELLGCSRTRIVQLEAGKVPVSADDMAIVMKRFPQLNVTSLVTGNLPTDYPSASFQYFLADFAHAADAIAVQDGRVLTAWRHDHAQILHLYESLKSRNLKPTDTQARELVTTTLRGLMSRI